jgi:uncharacterized membrane protein YccC
MRAKGAQLALMVATAIASIPILLVMWFGALGYGVLLARGGNLVLGIPIAVAGAAWVVHAWRDKTLPGLLFGAIHSLLIVTGLAKDPWDEDDDTLAQRLADERGS